MGGSQKSKKVTWASDVNLCQVRLFLSEDSPSQVGMGSQDHLQAKALWSVQSGGTGYDDNLPPGFEGVQLENMWKAKLSQIPLAKWKRPPKFEVNRDWLVVAGEESREVEAQNQRELRVLEAIYPRPSAIPSNPSELAGIKDSTNNDQSTPVVPVTPIEDEDAALDTSFGSTNINPVTPQPEPSSRGTFSSQGNSTSNPQAVEPDILAAAQAALTSIMSNNSPGSLIDRELLIKILSDPKMVEQLVTNHAPSAATPAPPCNNSTQNVPSSSSFHGTQHVPSSSVHMQSSTVSPRPAIAMQNVTSAGVPNIPSTSAQYIVPNSWSPPKSSFDPVNNAINRRDPLSAPITRPDVIPPSRAMPNGPFYPPSSVGPSPNPRPTMGAPVAKDINYYKSLIQQHGGERRDGLQQTPYQNSQPSLQEPLNAMKSRDSKPKIMKPCIYFNSPKGCRNGANCPFQHDNVSSQQQRVGGGMPEVQNAKRVKVDREITGT